MEGWKLIFRGAELKAEFGFSTISTCIKNILYSLQLQIYLHQLCSNRGLAAFPDCSCAVSNNRGTTYSHRQLLTTWLRHHHVTATVESGTLKFPHSMCIHPCHRTLVVSCFKILLRTDWSPSDPRRICLDALFLQWGFCSIMFQLKFVSLIMPGMERKRSNREELRLDDFSLERTCWIVHWHIQMKKIFVWLPRGKL